MQISGDSEKYKLKSNILSFVNIVIMHFFFFFDKKWCVWFIKITCKIQVLEIKLVGFAF